MGDHGEVGEMALYAGVKDGLGPGVAEGGPVLVQKVHQLFTDVSENIKRIPVKNFKKTKKSITMLVTEVFSY